MRQGIRSPKVIRLALCHFTGGTQGLEWPNSICKIHTEEAFIGEKTTRELHEVGYQEWIEL
ncbi:hypothetical protein BofuT4_uP018190.1 [Botrytis cinerea T4]|uniref:Uncharacterized protein n=1 Tax=Botryotinia fuckeliana (strain T4) TaxID=999810 RepID=G2YIH6_BOTF4|nr:hypothetical protein BofuT4_uP018190.1 [Botrytis cinerea T4]